MASVVLVFAAAGVLITSLRLIDAPVAEPSPEPSAEPADPQPEATPPTPLPERPTLPPPPPEPEPVVGTTETVEVVDLSTSGTGVFREGTDGDAAVPVDEEAVAAFAEQISVWFDTHLADLQLGGDGTIPALGDDPFGALTDTDHLVTEVTYAMRIAARGTPEWAEVTVSVTREDGGTLSTVLAVAPGDEPTLVAASAPASSGAQEQQTAAAGTEDPKQPDAAATGGREATGARGDAR